jgi:hypothetical protein
MGIAVHCCPICRLSFSPHSCACYKLLPPPGKSLFYLFLAAADIFTQLPCKFDVLLYQSSLLPFLSLCGKRSWPTPWKDSFSPVYGQLPLVLRSCLTSLTSCYTCVLSPAWLSAFPIRSYTSHPGTASFSPEQLLLLVYAAAAPLVLRSFWDLKSCKDLAQESRATICSTCSSYILHAKIGAFSEDT